MTNTTLHGSFELHPAEVMDSLDLELNEGQLMMLEALTCTGKDALELVLRSLFDQRDFINQRYYYLMFFAKSAKEKIRCLEYNLFELYNRLKHEGKKDQQLNQLMVQVHTLHLAELLWQDKSQRIQAEMYWKEFSLTPQFRDFYFLFPIILYRFPLFCDHDPQSLASLRAISDDMAINTYAKALSYFWEDPVSPSANKLLKKSLKLNPHVPSYLFDKKNTPKKPLGEIEAGELSEANYIAWLSAETWRGVPGALDWLKAQQQDS
jgi:hypothetical protein